MAMINADFEIKRQLLKTTATLRNTLKACIDTVAKTYFKYMYSNPALSDLAKSAIDGLNVELKELENESRKSPADKSVLIQYP